AQAVEEGGLAGAVRTDEAEDLPLVLVERNAVEGDDAAEAQVDIIDREQRRARARRRELRPDRGRERCHDYQPECACLGPAVVPLACIVSSPHDSALLLPGESGFDVADGIHQARADIVFKTVLRKL